MMNISEHFHFCLMGILYVGQESYSLVTKLSLLFLKIFC